jgi:hypothetical protein
VKILDAVLDARDRLLPLPQGRAGGEGTHG